MKLAIIYQSYFPPIKGASGADRRVRDFARGFAYSSCDVTMIIPSWRNSGINNSDLELGIAYVGGKQPTVLNRILFWPRVFVFLLTKRFDAVMFYNNTVDSLILACLLKVTKVTLFSELCDLRSSYSDRVSFFSSMKLYLLNVGERLLPKFMDFNIVISSYLENMISQSAGAKKIFKVPILVDTDLFAGLDCDQRVIREKWGVHADEYLIVYAGGLWRHEGVSFLIRAFAEHCANYPNSKLIIAGKLVQDDLHDDVESLVKQLGLDKMVVLTGWITTAEVVGILGAADVLCVPQIEHEFNRAGLPTKLAEYCSIGKPVIATKVGDVEVYFQNRVNALLCDPDSVESLRESLLEMRKNPSLAETLSSNAQQLAYRVFDYRRAVAPIASYLRK